jgi:acetyl-CoA carboxylase carboxyl transferase subunit beta
LIQTKKLEENLKVCPYCQKHYRLNAFERMESLCDPESFERFGEGMESTDPLEFVDKKTYKERYIEAKSKSETKESVLAGMAKIQGHKCCLGIMDFSFMGGSMGVVCGELITQVFERAAEHNVPAIVVSCSGGARMQEGILSLMQMSKVAVGRNTLKKKKVPYISVLTDPTTGGVAASFSMMGDITLAEPKALIGFAGPRVIEQSMGKALPKGFQRSEFLLDHGFLDQIVERKDLKSELAFYLKLYFDAKKTQVHGTES